MSKIGLKLRNGGDRDEILSFYEFAANEREEIARRGAVRDWVKHITPMEDGWSDPPGIKVRAHQGMEGTLEICLFFVRFLFFGIFSLRCFLSIVFLDIVIVFVRQKHLYRSAGFFLFFFSVQVWTTWQITSSRRQVLSLAS